ncbi:MAG TPA: hypothetical protein DCM87_22330 [Planctomycetes bacterium]|nr:hypothetical protein [Planctomycetota bacterium]
MKHQKSMKMTAPIGIRIMPQSATNSRSCIVTAGKIAVSVATRPTASVTRKREKRGITAWNASPAR